MTKNGLLIPVKGRAPIPRQFPGDFIVLMYDREGESYTLMLDDEDVSSFELGGDAEEIRHMFLLRTFEANGQKPQRFHLERFIDTAREFRTAQYIPTEGDLVQDKVFPVIPREAKESGLVFDDGEEETWISSLRRKQPR